MGHAYISHMRLNSIYCKAITTYIKYLAYYLFKYVKKNPHIQKIKSSNSFLYILRLIFIKSMVVFIIIDSSIY